ncbi:hypothetical protein [Paludibacterium yongneupense]|uniref:hypothetical protein n=1 Tax=Paludibacterium yongneupense TaxID=400061 RepID=UPI000404621E|nr:hypothetical protein [Paludibacterium yongneupense]
MTLPFPPRRAVALGVLLLLPGCAQLHRPRPVAPILPPCPGVEQALGRVAQARDGTLPNGGGPEACINIKLMQASQHLLAPETRTDLQHLQIQLEMLAARPELSRAQLSWCRLLLQQIAERRRLGDALEKQQALTREQQKRADDLAAKLNALRELENALLLKPGKNTNVQP